jgi:polyhydroxybutyrate depolymerase
MRNRGRVVVACLAITLLTVGCGGGSSLPTTRAATTLTPMPATSATTTPVQTPAASPPTTPAASPLVFATEQIQVDRLTRDYLVVTAQPGMSSAAAPLLLVLHGATQTMWDAEAYGFDAAVRQSGAVVVYLQGERDPDHPTAQGYIWNSGSTDTGVNDVAFVQALIERLTADYAIDSRSIFVLGASNGGQMAYRAACELSDHIAAVGDVNGPLLVDCQPSSPVSVIDVRGMTDTIWTPPSGGGQGCLPMSCPPLDDTQEAWRQIDGCIGDPAMITIAPKSIETEWTACEDGTAVAFIRAASADHFMRGADFDVPGVMWAFLRDHPSSGGAN